ncbi:DUF2785 domain-containing protein [Streptococcus cameli]
MKEKLQQKLQETSPYSRQELDWLLPHIGDEAASIRDDLVYASFAHALLGNRLTQDDFLYLAHFLVDKDYLFYRLPEQGKATLVRSFTALLLALILDVDARKESDYFQLLSPTTRQRIFEGSMLYLDKETDTRGWDETVGWVHAIAHGAELLLYASMHPDFPASTHQKVWGVLSSCINRQETAFQAGEEKRLALVAAQEILSGRLSQKEAAHHITNWPSNDQSVQDYFAALNKDHFLTSLYFFLKKEGQLQAELAHAIEESWTGLA